MNILWYFLTFVAGVLGLLALARIIERFALGGGISAVQAAIALIFLFLAWKSLEKARSRASSQNSQALENL